MYENILDDDNHPLCILSHKEQFYACGNEGNNNHRLLFDEIGPQGETQHLT